MGRSTINAELCAKMFLAGARKLEANKEWINELNVFPVPDGDTGTNMTLTIMSAAKDVAAMETYTMETLAKAISSGSLRGARGNSGVILSQLLRGFTKGIRGTEEIDVMILTEAFQKAVTTAYKAVMKPKEGTILTVAKGFADKATELALTEELELEDLLGQALAYAEEVLEKTPEMLPVLKEAGVVDSGGQGLIQVLKGAYDAFLGKETPETEEDALQSDVIRFGYDTEFLIVTGHGLTQAEEQKLRSLLEGIGELLVLAYDEKLVKIHVKTNDPGVVLTKALGYGAISSVRIENLREKHAAELEEEARQLEEAQKMEEARKQEEEQSSGKEAGQEKAETPHRETGFISVSIGDGIGEIFRSLGVDYLIEGGQTMNPSTEDMLKAIEEVNADTVYIFPNNKNIILAANQAQALTEDRKVIVIPTKTVPQGIAAVIAYDSSVSPEDNEAAMNEAIKAVRTGQVTYAVRDTHIDDKEIKEGNIMGIGDHSILAVGEDIAAVTKETVSLLVGEEAELISVYYGEEVSEEDAQALGEELRAQHPDCEVEVYAGGQPIYYYVVSAE